MVGSSRHSPRIVHPGVGVDAFRLGMTRPELWALTTSTVRSFLRGGAPEREDDFLQHGVCVAYEQGHARSFTVFARMESRERATIMILGEDVAAFTREDVLALLALNELARVDGYEDIRVPSLGLTFWFREDADAESVIEFVRVESVPGA